MNITVGGDLQVVKPAERPGAAARHGRDRARHLRVPGPPLRSAARRHAAVPRRAAAESGARRHRDADDPEHRRRSPRPRFTGTAKAPQLTLTSNPPLEESDILALIVFNRPVNELGTGERASLAATAGGIATGFIAAPLGESIGRALDLDLFEITTTTDEGDLGAGLTLGQQIGDRAFFKLRQQFGERNVTEFLLEYQLADFLRLQTTAAPGNLRLGQPHRPAPHRARRASI